MSHDIVNNHTANIGTIAPGETGSVSDEEFAKLIRGPLFRDGRLTCPNTQGDIMSNDTIVVQTSEATLTVAATTKLFQVTGGAVELIDLALQVTEAFGATASNGSFSSIIDEGPTTTALSTTVSVASAALGKYIQWPGAVGSATVLSSVGGAAIQGIPKYKMAPGEIDFITSGDTTGKFIATLRYRKLDPFAVVTPAF